MKVLRYAAPQHAEIAESEPPHAHGAVSVARTIASSISAGTEMAFFRGVAPQLSTRMGPQMLFEPCENAITYPMQSDGPGVWWMGYAAVGQVTEVAHEEKNLHEGDLVFLQSGHKELMASDAFLKLPEGTNPEHASLLALIDIAYNGMLDARVKLLDEVVIFGMGTLGQLLAQICKLSGANVTAIDRLDRRLELAKRLGADVVFNPAIDGDPGRFVQDRTRERGADAVFEVSGNIDALPHAIRSAAYGGVVTVLSFYQGEAENLHLGREFHHKRIRLHSSQIGGVNPDLSPWYDSRRRLESSVKLLNKLDLEPLISHRVRFVDLPSALEMIDRNPGECVAVVVTYDR